MSRVRKEKFVLELLNNQGGHVGYLRSVMVGMSITCQSTATIGRHISSLVVQPDDPWGADLVADKTQFRLKPWAIVTEDGTTTEYPLGVYVFSTVTPHERDFEVVAGTGLASGTYVECQLHDLGYLLSGRTTLTHTYNVTTGSGIDTAITELAEMAGIYDTSVATTAAVAGIDLAWAKGTPMIVPIRDLVQRCGLVGPWFDVAGTMRVTHPNHVGLSSPTAVFQPGTASAITAAGVQGTSDDYAMPNRWLVRSRLSSGVFISGEYPTTPPAHGFMKVIDIPGLATSSECEDRARDIAREETRVNDTRTFTARTVYTLELHDTVTYGDQDWMLDTWEVPLEPGSESAIRVREQVTQAA